MTTRILPAFILKAVPDLALADTAYLTAYASFMLHNAEATDGPIADARAQLTLLNERLEVEVATVTDTTADDLFGILTSLQALRDDLASQRPGTLSGETVTDNLGRLLCVVDVLAEVARRASGRECLVKKIVGTEAA